MRLDSLNKSEYHTEEKDSIPVTRLGGVTLESNSAVFTADDYTDEKRDTTESSCGSLKQERRADEILKDLHVNSYLTRNDYYQIP